MINPGAARWSRGVVEVVEEVFIKNISLLCIIRNYPHIRYKECRNRGLLFSKGFVEFPKRFRVSCLEFLEERLLCLSDLHSYSVPGVLILREFRLTAGAFGGFKQ